MPCMSLARLAAGAESQELDGTRAESQPISRIKEMKLEVLRSGYKDCTQLIITLALKEVLQSCTYV